MDSTSPVVHRDSDGFLPTTAKLGNNQIQQRRPACRCQAKRPEQPHRPLGLRLINCPHAGRLRRQTATSTPTTTKLWRSNLRGRPATSRSTASTPTATATSVVNAADYTVWRDNLGLGVPASLGESQGVPEPTAVVLLSLGVLTAARNAATPFCRDILSCVLLVGLQFASAPAHARLLGGDLRLGRIVRSADGNGGFGRSVRDRNTSTSGSQLLSLNVASSSVLTDDEDDLVTGQASTTGVLRLQCLQIPSWSVRQSSLS